MNKKIIAMLLIGLIALISTASFSYFVFSQANQTGDIANPLSPTPTPTQKPSPSPIPTLASSPREERTESSSISKPSVPEFDVRLVDNSYDVPTTYSIDPFTGETVVHKGYRVANESIVFTIKNQPFTPYTATDGNVTSLYYKIRVKGHFAEDWTELKHFESSYTKYTIKSYCFGKNSDIYMLRGVASGGQIDFQVQAFTGCFYEVFDYDAHSALFYLYFPGEYHFTGETSGWSSTQTITVP